MKRIVVLAAFLIAVTAGLAQAQGVSERLKGAAFAQQICAECHAVEAGQNPDDKAGELGEKRAYCLHGIRFLSDCW